MKEKYIGALYLAIAASIWGGMYVVVKVTVAVVPPLELVWMRYAVAGIVLVCTIWRLGYSFRLDKKDIPLIVMIGLIGNFLSIVTQEIGTMYTSAQMGAVITSATPAFMVLFAFFLLKEPMTVRKCASILLATAGVWLMIGPVAVQTDEFVGGLSLVFAALTWALMSVLLKRVPKKPSSRDDHICDHNCIHCLNTTCFISFTSSRCGADGQARDLGRYSLSRHHLNSSSILFVE